MRKVNISLVGGQPMPVYVGVEATEPDGIVLVHSSKSKSEAEIIKDYFGKPASLFELPAVDFSEICVKAEALLNQFGDYDVYVNISSGTKPWTVAFTQLAVGRENVTLFYIDQINNFHDLTHMKERKVEAPRSIDTILRYHNQHDYTHVDLSSYTSSDWNDHWLIRRLRSASFMDFKNLLSTPDERFLSDIYDDSLPQPKMTLPSGSYVSYDRAANSLEVKMVGRNWAELQVMDSPHIREMAFNTGWFEYEIAKMFEGWNYAKEIWMNVNFPAKNKKAKNEIDIIVDLGARLLFIECKTRLSKITDIDKFHNAANNYGGTGCMAIFITEEKLSPESEEKCEESNLLHFCLRGNHTGKRFSQYAWQECRKRLLQYLEQNIDVINKK